MLTREQLESAGEYLRGSCKDVGAAIEALGLGDEVDESSLEGALLEVETERCVQCDWWHEPSELQYDEGIGGGVCEQCCEELGIEFE